MIVIPNGPIFLSQEEAERTTILPSHKYLTGLNPQFTRAAYNALPFTSNSDFYRVEIDGLPCVRRRYLDEQHQIQEYTWRLHEPLKN